MHRGVIKFFNANRGFGFIKPEDGGADIFVHITAAEKAGIDELKEGDVLEFEIEKSDRTGKPQATNLVLAGAA